MEICGQQVLTPYLDEGDDPMGYAPDWRHQAARAIASCTERRVKLPDRIRDDPMVMGAVAYLKAVQSGVSGYARKYNFYHVANCWATRQHNGMRDLIDAAILSAAPFKRVSDLFGGHYELMHTYERMHYAIRCDGEPDKAFAGMRTWHAVGDGTPPPLDGPAAKRWKAQAILPGGLDVLVYQWGMQSEDLGVAARYGHIQQSGLALLSDRMVRGMMSSEDAISAIKLQLDQQRLELDKGKAGQDENWSLKILLDFVRLAGPRMASTAMSKHTMADTDAAIRSKIATEGKIKTAGYTDNGPGGILGKGAKK